MSFFESRLTESGYQTLPSGMIIQWGRAIGQNPSGLSNDWSQSSGAIQFAIPFTNQCVAITCSLDDGGANSQWVAIAQTRVIDRYRAGLLVHTKYIPTRAPTVTYIAIGY
ncbi:gp53-like domain-containing protein [Xenorhabdus griffiniae]|uniref:gp53-like domain-containing protein n=1 Tax=Xenorhabdus griffiniae TaxID=351672 RepID=UPI003AF31ABD